MNGDKAIDERAARWNRRVSVAYEPTPWSESCARLGLIALDTDHASERELRRMLPAERADLFTTRVRHG
ncbi:MAG TPA: hypothetical protein VKA32_01785, partial [Gammaproteobacteria bacterium]|nr:hypothetical protein [Gammaproteobacteria bacterium]